MMRNYYTEPVSYWFHIMALHVYVQVISLRTQIGPFPRRLGKEGILRTDVQFKMLDNRAKSNISDRIKSQTRSNSDGSTRL